jgi:starch synthase
MDGFYYTMGWATSTWYDRPKHYLKLQQQAMKEEFSWEDSTRKYLAVYKHAIKNRRG